MGSVEPIKAIYGFIRLACMKFDRGWDINEINIKTFCNLYCDRNMSELRLYKGLHNIHIKNGTKICTALKNILSFGNSLQLIYVS